MRRVQTSVGLFFLLTIFSVYHSPVLGQSGTQFRKLRGRIVNTSGAAIPLATVTLFSDDRVRTTEAYGDGSFLFSGLSGRARFVEASAVGFETSSIPIDEKSLNEPVVMLVGPGPHQPSEPPEICLQCGPLSPVDVRDRSVQWESTPGAEWGQLRGTVREYQGSPLAQASLVLMKADLDILQTAESSTNPNPPMSRRTFRYSFAADTTSDDKGEFRFDRLEPGWYSLRVAYPFYDLETREFWIPSENVTRPSPIEMLHPGDPSAMH